MLKVHKNAFFNAIQKLGFDPAQFVAFETSESSDSEFVIELRGTELVFVAKQMPASYSKFKIRFKRFEPGYPDTGWGDPTIAEKIRYATDSLVIGLAASLVRGLDEGYLRRKRNPNVYTFEETLAKFEFWLENVVRLYLDEKESPDLWSQIEMYQSIVSASLSAEDATEFSEGEKAQIRLAVIEFKRLVQVNFNPSTEIMDKVEARLDYLSNAVDRLNRFDWNGLLISTLIGIAINLSVDTEKGRFLLSLFQQAFQTTLRLLGSGS